MVDIETVFILGSGSSKPYNFPIDEELRNRIITDFKRDYLRIPYTSDFGPQSKEFEKQKRKEEVKSFIERLQDTEGICTIDEFISVNPQFEFIGKIAIQYYLLVYEKEYSASRRNNYVSDWFELVLKELLKEPIQYKDPSLLDSNNITFLTFNYDRVIEYLFIRQFVSLFKELLNTSVNRHQIGFFLYKIIHLYGSLGFIPQNEETNNFSEIKFGDILTTYERIKGSLDNIRLIKNGFREPDRIKRKIYNATKIYLLGIGYIENNMKLLDLESNINYDNPPQIYATALGKDKDEIHEIKTKYFNFTQSIPEPIIESVNCRQLIEKYFNK